MGHKWRPPHRKPGRLLRLYRTDHQPPIFGRWLAPPPADVYNLFPGHSFNGSFHTVNRRGFRAVYAGLSAGESLFHCEPSYIIQFVLFLI
jgi:hypothetical protein